jgi:hypothetical protein
MRIANDRNASLPKLTENQDDWDIKMYINSLMASLDAYLEYVHDKETISAYEQNPESYAIEAGYVATCERQDKEQKIQDAHEMLDRLISGKEEGKLDGTLKLKTAEQNMDCALQRLEKKFDGFQYTDTAITGTMALVAAFFVATSVKKVRRENKNIKAAKQEIANTCLPAP